jgi:energy-coupling factor transporter ATP-binding protein EcfA2
MPALKIAHLTYTYPTGKRPSLQNISLQVEKGELLAVIGANNSGKSTLCYAIAGVIPHFFHGQFNGSVLIGKVNTTDQTISALAEHVGLVMQIPGNQLSGVRSTVFEEIAFGLENLGISRQEMHERTTAALALTGLSAFAERSPYQLSGGQQQKVALAAVLAVSPSLLILDEPTTFLDPQGARQVFDILLELKRQGKTIILAEQRLEWVAECADRVIVLQDGKMMLCGTPEEVLSHPRIKPMGLDWLPYTKAAAMARDKGFWAKDRPLSSTFSATVAGLQNS